MSPRAPGALLCWGGGRARGSREGEIKRRVKMWVYINIFEAVSKSFLVGTALRTM